MSLMEVIVEGTINPDGTLHLDEKPHLPPGRVTVVLRQKVVTAPPVENWFECLLRLRAKREAEGYPFVNEADATAHVEWLREADRIDDLLREADEQA